MRKLLIFCFLALVCFGLTGCSSAKKISIDVVGDVPGIFNSVADKISEADESEEFNFSNLLDTLKGVEELPDDEKAELTEETLEVLKSLEGLTIDDLVGYGVLILTPTPTPTKTPELEEAGRNLKQQEVDMDYLDSCGYKETLKVGFAKFRHTDTNIEKITLFEDDTVLACTSAFNISCNTTALGEGLLLDTDKYNQSVTITLKNVYIDGKPVEPINLVLMNPSLEPVYFETNDMYNCPEVILNYLITEEVESVIVEYDCKMQSYDEDLKSKTSECNIRMVLYERGRQ